MAVEIPLFKPGIVQAGVDMTSDHFHACSMVADFTVGLPVAGGKIFGVVQNKPILGEAVEVEVYGISKISLVGTVAAGDDLMVDANGLFLKATSGNHIVATAIESGVAGNIVTALLKSAGLA